MIYAIIILSAIVLYLAIVTAILLRRLDTHEEAIDIIQSDIYELRK